MSTTPYRFKADTSRLLSLCTKRHTAMQGVRNANEGLWKDIRDNFEPDIAKALDGGTPATRSADRNDGKILNSKPRTLLHRMAAGLQSGITNQSQRWFALGAVDKKTAQRAAIKKWFSDVNDIMSESMASGNLYTVLDNAYLHMPAFGQACFVIFKGDQQGEVHNELIDTGDFWIADNRRGRVNVLIRRIWMTVEKMKDEFGEGWLPDNLRDDSGTNQTEYEIFNLILPNDGREEFGDIPKARPFISIYWIPAYRKLNDGILAVRGFDYNPIVAPRWAVAGSVYGYGPGKMGLGDAEELQTMERDKLTIIAQDATPTVRAPAKLRGNTMLDNYPGGVVWDDTETTTVSRLFETRQGITGVLEGIRATTERLNETFYSDLFAMMLNRTAQTQAIQMTAREVSELSGEKTALLGPVLTRMNSDLLDPIVYAYFYILYEDGAFPPPPQELIGLPWSVSYSSALHIEQIYATKMKGLMNILDVVGMVAKLQPSALDKFDGDQTIDEICAANPNSAAVILDDEEVDKIRKDRAAKEEQQQRMIAIAQMAPGVGRGVRDLSQAPVNGGTGTALDAIIKNETGAQQ